MLDKLRFHGQALLLRSERQSALAANIANADTPNYKARDFDFARALAAATAGNGAGAPPSQAPSAAGGSTLSLIGSNGKHLNAGGLTVKAGGTALPLQYRQAVQASGDGNSVDMDRERANFADNAIRYEATLRFINSDVRTMLSAIRGD